MALREEHRSFCTLCRSQCGTINVAENGRLIEIKPDSSHPTGGAMCLKGKAGPEIVAANNRILFPMRRTNPKSAADPGWERVSWDEALMICAEKLGKIRAESGPEAVAFAVTTKSGTGIADSIEWVDRFVRIFGSPNIAGATDVCNWHKDVAHRFTFGVGMPMADYANSNLILLWGHNPTSTWLAQADAIGRGRKSGAAMIVVDPRPTPLALDADVWLQVRPGTDAAVAMGLSALLIEQGLIDEVFVRNWSNAPFLVRMDNGQFLKQADVSSETSEHFVVWDEAAGATFAYDSAQPPDVAKFRTFALRGEYAVQLDGGSIVICRPAFSLFADACKEWTPKRVAEVAGVPEDKLSKAAELIGQSPRIAYHAWNGVGQSVNATQTERAIATLYALRGCFDEVGGNRIFASQPVNKADSLSLIDKEQLAKALGSTERPLGPPAEGRVKPIDVYRALATGKPYSIRALVAFGTNHLLTQGDTDEIRQGLERAEFHVHCDIVETPSSQYADILLPVNTPWEREALRVGFDISEEAANLIQLRPRMVAPRGEARSDMEIVFELACRLGFGAQFFDGDIEAAWNHVLSPLGVTVADLRAHDGRRVRSLNHVTQKYMIPNSDGKVGFNTETRRVEFYSELLLRNGQSPLPVHITQDVNRKRFPLLLTSMKSGYFCHSQHRGIASLRRRTTAPILTLHPNLAETRGIQDGQWVEVESRFGKARFLAKLDELLAEEVMAAEFGWWEGCEPLGSPSFPSSGRATSNFNVLVSADERDPISGSVAHKAVRCEIRSVEDRVAQRWTGFAPFRVSALRKEAANALAITLSPENGEPLPGFEPGQYLRIRFRSPATGEELIRAYSLTGKAGKGAGCYSICVAKAENRAQPEASMSNVLHEHLAVGDLIEAEVPAGKFTIPVVSSVPVVLVATGIGITPFVSYLETLAEQGSATKVLLLYGNRNSNEHAFAKRLDELSAILPNLSIERRYSRPGPNDAAGRDYDTLGRVDPDHIDARLISQGARVYCCGSDAMISAFKTVLPTRGIAKFDIFSEAFVTQKLDLGAHKECRVRFNRSGVEFTWTPDKGTLLDCADRLNIAAPSGCRAGQCESCAVRVIEGQTAQISGTHPEEDNIVFTCQGVPLGDVVLDL